ncbi:MAG: DUF2752 domain-containing protein [Bacteroidota bacterium]
MITCSWKKTLGIECPGCGFQRSFWKLVQGDFYDSIVLFPATIPLIATLILLLLHLKFKFKHGAYSLVALFSLSVFLILFNFIWKLC